MAQADFLSCRCATPAARSTFSSVDQLLALQLGRPSITSSESFCVPLPSTLDDSKHDWYTDDIELPEAQEQSVGDYFLHVIEFSKIVVAALGIDCTQNRRYGPQSK